MIAATVGATLVFLAARYLFADAARRRMGALGEKINAGFTENAFNYLLFLRLVPLFPFFLVNLAPAFTQYPAAHLRRSATFIGIIPGDVRLREPRRDARAHRFAVGAACRRRRSARSCCSACSRSCRCSSGNGGRGRPRTRDPPTDCVARYNRGQRFAPIPGARCTPRCRSSKRLTFRRSPAARSTRCRSTSATAATRRATTATSTRAPTARR